MKRTLILVVLFGTTLLIASLLGLLFANFPQLMAGEELNAQRLLDAPVSYAAGSLIAYALLALVLLALRYVRFPLWRRQSCTPLRGTGLGLTALVFLAFGMALLVTPFDIEDPVTMAMMDKMAHTPIGMFVLVIAGPFVEEVVFREGMLSALRQSRYHAMRAAFLSAALFAVVHGNLAQALPAFTLGLLLAAFYIATGDLRLPLMGHILNNALAVITILLPGFDAFEQSLDTLTSIIAGALFCSIGLVFALKWWRIQRKASIKWIIDN